MTKIGNGAMPARQVLETSLMMAAIDFSIAYEKHNPKMMELIHKGVTIMLQADPEFTKELMLRRDRAYAQMTEDLRRAALGQAPITPGTPRR